MCSGRKAIPRNQNSSSKNFKVISVGNKKANFWPLPVLSFYLSCFVKKTYKSYPTRNLRSLKKLQKLQKGTEKYSKVQKVQKGPKNTEKYKKPQKSTTKVTKSIKKCNNWGKYESIPPVKIQQEFWKKQKTVKCKYACKEYLLKNEISFNLWWYLSDRVQTKFKLICNTLLLIQSRFEKLFLKVVGTSCGFELFMHVTKAHHWLRCVEACKRVIMHRHSRINCVKTSREGPGKAAHFDAYANLK